MQSAKAGAFAERKTALIFFVRPEEQSRNKLPLPQPEASAWDFPKHCRKAKHNPSLTRRVGIVPNAQFQN
jgi:hypothetical protein